MHPLQKPLSPEEIQRYQRRLQRELAAHAAEVEEIEARALTPSGADRGQEVDESVEETGLDADLDVLAFEDRLGEEIHGALERIRDGRYGACESCARPIERQRLELVPYARLCAPCAGTVRRQPGG